MESTRNHMNKIYALESRHSASQGVTRYLMPGNRHQLTSSTIQARKFFSFDDACAAAQKIGGMKVVELNFTGDQIVQLRDSCLAQSSKKYWQELLNHMNPEITSTHRKQNKMNKTLYCAETGNPTPEFLIELAKMLGGRPWANHGKFRIYFDEGRRTQVYLNFEDGWSLNIWLEPCGQTAKWYANRKRDLQEQYTRHIRVAIGSHHFGEAVTAYSAETNADIEKMVAEFTAKMDQVCA